MSCVEVRDLRVELAGGGSDIVDEISFAMERGEILGLVGESGSGKTTVGNALLGYARRGARIARGSVTIDGVQVLELGPAELREARGSLVAYIPQDPSAALNPVLRIGRLVEEGLAQHAPQLSEAQRREAVAAGLEEVGLPGDGEFLRRYPHQLSGGQQQRVTIAMAFLLHPKVIVLDEPTTGLDVTTQQRVIEMVRRLCVSHGAAAIYVTHDLSVVANLADRIMVAYAGRIVESGPTEAVFRQPAHPYTRRLLAALPDIERRRALEPIPGRAPAPGARPIGCAFRDRCQFAEDRCASELPPLVGVADGHEARCVRLADLPAASPLVTIADRAQVAAESVLAVRGLSAHYGLRQVLHDVELAVSAPECLALVGESGSGKTTLARAIVGLLSSWEGEIVYAGKPLAAAARSRPASTRRELQYVFQSPYNSLNPRRTIGDSISLPAEYFFKLTRRAARERVANVLERVSLPAHYAERFPDQLSGGERQRAAIARALVCEPKVLICDEVTSALDVSVQAAIVKLLFELQRAEGLALLFVTHDLALVRSIADRVVVMHDGRIVESGGTETVLDRPVHGYTQRLLTDTPRLATAVSPAPALLP
jgi:peptide/nickel transport system ATP-binding protein